MRNKYESTYVQWQITALARQIASSCFIRAMRSTMCQWFGWVLTRRGEPGGEYATRHLVGAHANILDHGGQSRRGASIRRPVQIGPGAVAPGEPRPVQPAGLHRPVPLPLAQSTPGAALFPAQEARLAIVPARLQVPEHPVAPDQPPERSDGSLEVAVFYDDFNFSTVNRIRGHVRSRSAAVGASRIGYGEATTWSLSRLHRSGRHGDRRRAPSRGGSAVLGWGCQVIPWSGIASIKTADPRKLKGERGA